MRMSDKATIDKTTTGVYPVTHANNHKRRL